MDLISVFIAIVIVGLLAYLVQAVIPMPAPFRIVAQVVLVLFLVVWLANGLGHFPALHR